MLWLEVQTAKRLTAALTEFGAGRLTAESLDAQVRFELRRLFLAAMLRGLQVGKFWRNELLGNERSKLNELTERQYGYWAKFLADLAARRSSGQAFAERDFARLRTYPALARGALEWGKALGADTSAQATWRMGSFGDEHCPACEAEAARGARPVTALTLVPGEGRTPCLWYCTCALGIR